MTDILEFNSSDIQAHFDDNPVNIKDIQAYVESSIVNREQPKKANTSQTNGQYGFTVSQDDFLDYLIAKRDEKKQKLKRYRFRRLVGNCLYFMFKTLFTVIILCTVCWGFYMIVWTMQRVIE